MDEPTDMDQEETNGSVASSEAILGQIRDCIAAGNSGFSHAGKMKRQLRPVTPSRGDRKGWKGGINMKSARGRALTKASERNRNLRMDKIDSLRRKNSGGGKKRKTRKRLGKKTRRRRNKGKTKKRHNRKKRTRRRKR